MTNQKRLPQQVRRRNSARITLIPIDGRKGAPPAWPLDTQTPEERKRWKTLWAKPQAVIWETMALELEVALYCRISLMAEEPGAPTRLLAEVRQTGDRLLLNPWACFRAQIQVVDQEGTSHSPVSVSDLAVYRTAVGTTTDPTPTA